ncbi:unnamed protein product [Gongylonema pulchrum]|uniref:Uncharacterized protein n=1 Tax=Gongylonema pulchrum TaxID=637853 RepID=A0A183EHL9_9BILA|nr:unnamed protein product [Gongylonema pulchrum]
MAVYIPDDLESQPDDPAPQFLTDKQTPSAMEKSPSFTTKFVEKIKNHRDYSCVDLKRCSKCDTVESAISRETQTVEQQPPWPKIVDMPARCVTDTYHLEQII